MKMILNKKTVLQSSAGGDGSGVASETIGQKVDRIRAFIRNR